MKSALNSLPCIEPSCVCVDIKTKRARFQVKKDEKCDVDEVKQAVAKAESFKVTDIKLPTPK